jgi:hypothetical protein
MTDLNYNAADFAARRALAATLLASLRANFAKGKGEIVEQTQGSEIVLIYVASPTVALKVYTSCKIDADGVPTARHEGRDAIRVAAVRRGSDGVARGMFAKMKRVNRTGKVSAIVERTMSRVRLAWTEANAVAG